MHLAPLSSTSKTSREWRSAELGRRGRKDQGRTFFPVGKPLVKTVPPSCETWWLYVREKNLEIDRSSVRPRTRGSDLSYHANFLLGKCGLTKALVRLVIFSMPTVVVWKAREGRWHWTLVRRHEFCFCLAAHPALNRTLFVVRGEGCRVKEMHNWKRR